MKRKLGIPYEGFAQSTRKIVPEGFVLLENKDKLLPLKKGENISIFGRIQIDYYRCGTGSGGAVNVLYEVNVLEGLRNNNRVNVNEELASIYEEWIKDNPFDNGGGGWAAEPWHQKEMPLSQQIVKDARDKSDKAIIVIGRTAGEDKDNADTEGSYRLTEEELDMIRQVSSQYDDIILLLNVAATIDMSWLEKEFAGKIKAVLMVWQAGQEGGNAIADCITGLVSPSGKLTDTIAYSIEDYPSTKNFGNEDECIYQEDIYVGYRYFETFAPDKVQYEFGYGLTYTDFEISILSGKTIVKDEEKYINIEVKVTNIGSDFPAKEVVQVYYEAPQGKLGRPVKELIAFKKTKELKPLESQVLSIDIKVNDMASYDDGGYTGNEFAYVLEAGNYYFHLGNSIKNTNIVKIDNNNFYNIENLTLVKSLQQAAAPTKEFTRIKPGNRKEDGTYELIHENVPLRKYDLKERIISNLPKTIKQTGNKGIKLKDVYDKKATMEDFIGQLTNEELAIIVRGEGMSSPKVTPGTASAFGGVSDSLFSYGIPIASTADGPSGIRMDSGLKATQVPIGTLLAATWNLELVEEMFITMGKELLRNEVDTLLGPGVNIHRNPLNGRNFEYFSEDPLVTGLFSIAMTKGIMAGGSTATLKHYACNSQEKSRLYVDAIVSERALREIYIKAFEMTVKKANANTIMTAYNPVNGHWTASNYDLNTTILRQEWGFKGILMTDWWAQMNDVEEGGKPSKKDIRSMVRSQNDLYMVVANDGAAENAGDDNTLQALENGNLTVGELQRSAINICNFIMNAPVFSRKQEFTSIAKEIKSASKASSDNIQKLKEDKRVKPSLDKPFYIKVDKAGKYNIGARISYADTSLSQSVCNLLMNDNLVTTFQLNGTEGKWITKDLVQVILEEGFYELKLDFAKAGMEIEWFEFS